MRAKLFRALTAVPAAFVLAAGVAVASPAQSAERADSPYERGPDPTEQGLRAERGPFEFQTVGVTDQQSDGFGSGTIYYPTDTSQGTFGGVAISPGFVSPEDWVAWLGPRLASQGFVVITITTNTRVDQPAGRGRQLLAALDYLTTQAPAAVRQRLDTSRLAVMGHSMGGGGTMEAAKTRPDLEAAVPLAPWHLDKDWSDLRVPTMIIGAENDLLAAVNRHSLPFYNSMSATPEKAYAEIAGSMHMVFTREHPVIGKLSTAWLKRFVDDDTRYDKFLCPPPRDAELSQSMATCPIG
jgi:dienelactone hydrolase